MPPTHGRQPSRRWITATRAARPTAAINAVAVGRTSPAASVHAPASTHCRCSTPTSAQAVNAQNSASV